MRKRFRNLDTCHRSEELLLPRNAGCGVASKKSDSVRGERSNSNVSSISGNQIKVLTMNKCKSVLKKMSIETAPPPPLQDCISYIKALKKKSVYDLLAEAVKTDRVLIQPRCGVGGFEQMRLLLLDLENQAKPDVLTLTIDSYTRLKRFDVAADLIKRNPERLNGFPLVGHGWKSGRQINESVQVPVEIRHGSPDPRTLFQIAIASGFTSFEGAGICYNLPYAKDVPLTDSLKAWREVDEICGYLAKEDIIVDRELFGTLTAVLVPPSISLAISILEALLACLSGVKCLSIAYPQNGSLVQDIAALRSIPLLAKRYLPGSVNVFPTLHEFMGPFPKDRIKADALILFGALTARLGNATRLINKTNDEAFGIPTVAANVRGILTAKVALSTMFDAIKPSQELVEEEIEWTLREVEEILAPILTSGDLLKGIVRGFEEGGLDIPFSASRYAKSDVIPLRDVNGAVRYYDSGRLPFSKATKARNQDLLSKNKVINSNLIERVTKDIYYFA